MRENREVRSTKSADKRDCLSSWLVAKAHLMDEEHLVVNLYAEIVRLDDQVVLVALAVAGEMRIRVLAVIVNFLSSSGGRNVGSADTLSVRMCGKVCAPGVRRAWFVRLGVWRLW